MREIQKPLVKVLALSAINKQDTGVKELKNKPKENDSVKVSESFHWSKKERGSRNLLTIGTPL